MTDTIEPALTADEWKAWKAGRLRGTTLECLGRPAFALALANAELPDDDPRKITRMDLKALDAEISVHDYELQALRAKLAALLPPE